MRLLHCKMQKVFHLLWAFNGLSAIFSWFKIFTLVWTMCCREVSVYMEQKYLQQDNTRDSIFWLLTGTQEGKAKTTVNNNDQNVLIIFLTLYLLVIIVGVVEFRKENEIKKTKHDLNFSNNF